MMKKSMLTKSFGSAFTAVIAVGAFSYSSERLAPKPVDVSAFKNIAANVEALTAKKLSENVSEANKAPKQVTSDIIGVIEKEVQGKIQYTRYTITKAKEKKQVKTAGAEVVVPVGKRVPQTLTQYEINNQDLIKLYGYKIESHRYESFKNAILADTNDMTEDSVSTAQAGLIDKNAEEISPVASITSEEHAESVAASTQAQESAETAYEKDYKDEPENEVAVTPAAEDDLVVFDYADNSAKPKKIFDAPISASVKEAIEREVHKSLGGVNSQNRIAATTQNIPSPKRRVEPSSVTTDKDLLAQALADEDNTVFDYTTAATEEKQASTSALFAASAAEEAVKQSEFRIKVKEINLNTQRLKTIRGYEFIPDYDRGERLDDNSSGEIVLGYSLTDGVMNTQMGVVQAPGMIPTRVELNLLNKGMNIPVFNEEGIQKFLQRKGYDIVGNLLMVAIDSGVVDVEIDSDFQQKIYFNKNFKFVEDKADALYVLFAGVKNGNILTRYLLDNKETAQKIVYVGEGELYYEDPEFLNTQREMYTFTTRSLLGRKVKELNIDGSLVSFYGTTNTSKKKALNAYEIKVPELISGSRKYLEFKHFGTSLFVGTDKEKDIEIPGQDFIGKVLQVNELSELGNRCMVQINLTKNLRDIKVAGKNIAGEMFAETSFLDFDGNFSRDNSELAEKVFVTGDLEGVFNARLDYADGSTEFLKSYCREGSYIIEQL